MKIEWDEKIYNSFSDEIKDIHDQARAWICGHLKLSKKYIDQVQSNHPESKHPALWFSLVMSKIEEGIDHQEQDAIDLGCLFVIHAQKSPFGRTHKSNILVRLKRNFSLIKHHHLEQLETTHSRLKQMKYPPREVRELTKLIKKVKEQKTD